MLRRSVRCPPAMPNGVIRTSLRVGFAGHPAALRENTVRYYGHAVE
jgi:hypothetical protein